jgi:transcriptional regulator with GAF, ATPase, and Fis domain
MTHGWPTLLPSQFGSLAVELKVRVAGLVRVFGNGAAMAAVLPLRGGVVELGRDAAAPDDALDPHMSRRHARVEFDGRSFWVDDLGSQNGTFVDGERAPRGERREVQRVIRVGESLFIPCPDIRGFEKHGVAVHDGFVRGPTMRRLLAEVARAAELGFSLCLHGESGTGKEGVARAFHRAGPFSEGPFVPVNCAAIPQGIAERLLFGVRRGAYSGAEADADGYVQAADRGTLFLDEVADLDLQVQAKLLRALEMREVMALGAARPRAVDLRFCSASNRDLRAQVTGGKLREDLYYRIARPAVTLPPLRDRPEEIPMLIERELRRMDPALTLHVSLVEGCLLRPWPGNVRELLVEARSAGQAALIQSTRLVELRHLDADAGKPLAPSVPAPVDVTATPSPRDTRSRTRPLDPGERARIEEVLRGEQGNVAAAARALGMHRTQLRRLIGRHGIGAPDDRGHE